MGRRMTLAAMGLLALAMSGCATAGGPAASGDAETTTSTSVAASTPGSNSGSEPDDGSPLRDGTYQLAGTQTCRAPMGEEGEEPLFPGSTLVVDGDRAVITLRNEPLEAPITIDGSSFRIRAVFALDGTPRPAGADDPVSTTDLVLELSGTSEDSGLTIAASGMDTGVNCGYRVTGRWGEDPAGLPCEDPDGLVAAVVASPPPGTGSVTADDVTVLAETAGGRWVLYTVAPSAREAFGFCSGGSWLLNDLATAHAVGCSPLLAARLAELGRPCPRVAVGPDSSSPTTASTTTTPTEAADGACTAAAVQAALAAGEAVFGQPRCQGDYAIAEVTITSDGIDIVTVLRRQGDGWTVVTLPDTCGQPNLPPMVVDLCEHPVG